MLFVLFFSLIRNKLAKFVCRALNEIKIDVKSEHIINSKFLFMNDYYVLMGRCLLHKKGHIERFLLKLTLLCILINEFHFVEKFPKHAVWR